MPIPLPPHHCRRHFPQHVCKQHKPTKPNPTRYVRCCAVVSFACYIITGTCVHTVNGAFAITFFRCLANAAMELLFGVILADHACRAPKNAGAIQATAFGARNMGSLAAYAAGLLIFPPSGGQRVSNRTAIALTAMFPAFVFALSAWLPDSATAIDRREGKSNVSALPVLWFMPLFVLGQLSGGSFGLP
jgi:hypothetical protein